MKVIFRSCVLWCAVRGCDRQARPCCLLLRCSQSHGLRWTRNNGASFMKGLTSTTTLSATNTRSWIELASVADQTEHNAISQTTAVLYLVCNTHYIYISQSGITSEKRHTTGALSPLCDESRQRMMNALCVLCVYLPICYTFCGTGDMVLILILLGAYSLQHLTDDDVFVLI